MSQSRKICVFTGTRAEYGLLSPLIHRLNEADDFVLQLLVTGSHLSPEYGHTYKEIEKDGFQIDAKCEILLASSSRESVAKATGLGLLSFSSDLARMKPDVVVILGDRYEALACAATCLFMQIPVIHFHGGETTEGAFDEAIRHSITKMSHLHFTATERYRQRVLQLGENPENVYALGAIGIDNIKEMDLLDRDSFADSIDFKLLAKNVIVTFHPVTLGEESSESQMMQLLSALDQLRDVGVIFTMPNADADSKVIMELIKDYCDKNNERARCYSSLGQLRYLSALKHVDAVVGNSSSGLIEAPSLGTPTVNIGDRQLGRDSGPSVLDCGTGSDEIITAMTKVMDEGWRKTLDGTNIYGNGNVTESAMEVIRKTDFKGLLQKKFYDYHG